MAPEVESKTVSFYLLCDLGEGKVLWGCCFYKAIAGALAADLGQIIQERDELEMDLRKR